jgi:hypothetical protein
LAVDDVTAAARGAYPFGLGELEVAALVEEAAINDANVSVRTSLLTALGLPV